MQILRESFLGLKKCFCYRKYIPLVALVIGFNQSTFTFEEPDNRLVREEIYLVKENNRQTEQSFVVRINLLSITGNIQPATENLDYRLSISSGTTTLLLLPTEDEITLQVTLFPNDIVRWNEGFILDTSPSREPRYTTPSPASSVFKTLTIVIRDNDRKFSSCSVLYIPISCFTVKAAIVEVLNLFL